MGTMQFLSQECLPECYFIKDIEKHFASENLNSLSKADLYQ
jgi:hypothetical protein